MMSSEEWKKLYKYAKTIPSLGIGGKRIARSLIKYASKVRTEESIVEFGSWLGSATAFLALGTLKTGQSPCIHTYDMWTATEEYAKKAKLYHAIDFEIGQNLLPLFLKNMKVFPVNIIYNQKDVLKMQWNSTRKIRLVVDDICNKPEYLYKMMKTIDSRFIPNRTYIIVMDYYFYENERKDLIAQKTFYETNEKHFKFLERLPNSQSAVFKYLGGWKNIDYECIGIRKDISKNTVNGRQRNRSIFTKIRDFFSSK